MCVPLQTLIWHRGPVGCSISPAGSCSWGCWGRSRGGRAQEKGMGSLHAEIHTQGWSYSNTTGTEVTPVLSSPGHHPRAVGRAGVGIHPSRHHSQSWDPSQSRHISSAVELLCVSPSLSGAGLVALRCPPSVSPLQPCCFLGPVAELCLIQALYLFSFSMHTSGALLRHKIINMTVPR